MRLVNLHKILFVFATAMAVGSCVPKASDKKATCGVNEAFDSVSRSCYSIVEVRHKPVATTASETLTQETPKTITLGYTDKNNDKAISCSVTGVSANLEVMSPALMNGNLLNAAEDVESAANDIVNYLNTAPALAAQSTMADAITIAKTSYSYSKIVAKIGVFKIQATAIATLVAGSTVPTLQFFYNLLQTRMSVLNTHISALESRCECAAGVCSATVVPRIGQSGTGGFTYTVTDADGTSSAKVVTATIAALSATTSHLKPVAVSSDPTSDPANVDIFEESSTSAASTYAFTISPGSDISGTTNFTYTFNGAKNATNQGKTTLGLVWGCMDLAGSSGTTDRSCIYLPNSGDTYDNPSIIETKAQVTIGDLTFAAHANGTYANNYTIQYFSLQNYLTSIDPYLTKAQLYGMTSSAYNESFIRVVGNAIKIFINPDITSTEDIRELVNDHPQASKLVVAIGGSSSTFPAPGPVTAVATPLVGGVDGFDKVPFTVSNGGATSTNTAVVTLKMLSTDDIPAMNYVASASSSALEDLDVAAPFGANDPILINLSTTFSDIDTADADTPYINTCNVDPLDAVFLTNFTVNSCNCAGVTCTLSVTPNVNVSSTTAFMFAYRVRSFDGITYKSTEYRNYYLTMTPVNDAPVIPAIAPQTIAESTSTVPNSGSVTIAVDNGGGSFESSQTLTLTATSSDQALLKDENIVITTPVAGQRKITYTPELNKSGSVTITLTLKDNGGTTNGGVDQSTGTISLTITPVNDPPYFISMFDTVDTNEGGIVQTDGVLVDEDMGSSSDENSQNVRITLIESDNHAVLPPSAVSFYYDLNDNGVEDKPTETRAVNGIIDTSAAPDDDVKLHKLYFKLTPVNGVAGNANITITLNDGTSSTQKSFSLVVHSISAVHGGWENISAVGIKTDKNNFPVTELDSQCNYNKSTDANKCDGSDCTGIDSPHGAVVPDAANVIFYDSNNKKCYRSTSASKFSWVDLKTSCPITRQTGVCSDNNCIGTALPTPGFVGQYFYNETTGVCSVASNLSPATWQTFVPSKITLSWKPFTMTGTGVINSGVQIAGWNIYRREAGADYNFKGGHLQTSSSTATMSITTPSTRTFTDTTAIAGKVYYYLVRPVDNRRNLPTHTSEIFSEVRITAPTANYTFVHRWMINQEICNSMNMTTTTTNKVDTSNNYRCPYIGPGESTATPGYYDYGSDLLVDVQEMGCAYAAAPKCTSDGCVGIGTPAMTGGGLALGDLFYDRSTGTCFAYTGAAWSPMESATGAMILAASSVLNTSLNAPLVNVTQSKAATICSTRPDPVASFSGLQGALTRKLPNKKDYIAYSAHPLSIDDSIVLDLEQGFSLNLQSRCNGSAANGLEIAYTDSSIPPTSYMYSLSGTSSSGIRSLVTGSVPLGSSKSTESCVSRYGVQDVYGNVAEWTTDQMNCASRICTPVSVASVTSVDYTFRNSGGTALRNYAFDSVTGPYYDSNPSVAGPDVGDDYIVGWTLADEMYDAGKFSLPIGMPINNNISTHTSVDTAVAIPFLLDVGPGSGITTTKLHDDAFILNGEDGNGSLAVGGSYASGTRVGRWTTERVPDTVGKDTDVGFRCVLPVLNTNYRTDSANTYNYPY